MTASDILHKQALDREVPYHMIPRKDLSLYEQAERNEWMSWQDLQCVGGAPRKAKEIMKRLPRSRLIRLQEDGLAHRTDASPGSSEGS